MARRTREIGLRVAVGATPGAITRRLIGEMVAIAGGGLVVGLLGALAASTLARHLLSGITPSDPLTFVASTALVLAFAVVASYLPARRAARIDPVIALRTD